MKPQAFDAQRFLARLWAMDAELVKHGFHATSPWWRREIERFVRALASGQTDAASARVRRWVIRAGRRSGKSSTLCRLAVAWARWGTWHVPTGDIAVVAFASISRDEASSRLRTIGQILEVLGVGFAERGEELETTGPRPVLFKVFSASTRSVGFTAILVLGDEVSRWESRETAANPAREVFGSLLPTLASQPYGFSVVCSSPWSTDDYHAALFEQGNTAHQIVSSATTWEANPTISEARTRELEPDPRTWSREYANEPGATVSVALDPDDIEACYAGAARGRLAKGFVAIDASSLREDAFTYLCGRETDGQELVVLEAGGWDGAELRRVSMHTIVRTIAARAKHYGVRYVFGDQREEAGLKALFSQQGTILKTFAWSETSKDDAVMRLRRAMRERSLFLPSEPPTLKRELLGMKARLMPSGRITYATNGLDYASALITLMHAVVAGDVRLDVRKSRAYSDMRERGQRLRGFMRARRAEKETATVLWSADGKNVGETRPWTDIAPKDR